MMKTFEEYVREKDLTVNVSKTKMMCFRKSKQKIEYEWRIAGEGSYRGKREQNVRAK